MTPAEIAAKLTPTMRNDLSLFVDGVHDGPILSDLLWLGLVEFLFHDIGSYSIPIGFRLTPLGIAVREELEREGRNGSDS